MTFRVSGKVQVVVEGCWDYTFQTTFFQLTKTHRQKSQKVNLNFFRKADELVRNSTMAIIRIRTKENTDVVGGAQRIRAQGIRGAGEDEDGPRRPRAEGEKHQPASRESAPKEKETEQQDLDASACPHQKLKNI